MSEIAIISTREVIYESYLQKSGKILVAILDFFDENHCENSIKEF